MIAVFDGITILICTFIMLFAVKQIVLDKKITYINISILVMWFMQVMPLCVEKVFGYDVVSIPYMKKALEDTQTGMVYDLLTIVSFFAFWLYDTQKDTTINIENNGILRRKVIKYRGIISFFLGIMIFIIPLTSIIMAPSPKVYFHFVYFYRFPYIVDGSEDVYHRLFMSKANWALLFVILATYYLRKNNKICKNIDVLCGVIIYIWISNKRASIFFALMGILAIDFMKNREKKEIKHFIWKTVLFALFVIIYFIIYSKITGKGSTDPTLLTYMLYFGRDSAEKVAIYDRLYTKSMLNYPGETIIFDMFFWVFRRYWPGKPFPYTKYYTGYAFNGDGMIWMGHNLQANIWAEYVSNFGIIGHLLALIVVFIIIKVSTKSNDSLVKLFGLLFVVIYLLNAFEMMLYFVSVLWIFTLFRSKSKWRFKVSI